MVPSRNLDHPRSTDVSRVVSGMPIRATRLAGQHRQVNRILERSRIATLDQRLRPRNSLQFKFAIVGKRAAFDLSRNPLRVSLPCASSQANAGARADPPDAVMALVECIACSLRSKNRACQSPVDGNLIARFAMTKPHDGCADGDDPRIQAAAEMAQSQIDQVRLCALLRFGPRGWQSHQRVHLLTVQPFVLTTL